MTDQELIEALAAKPVSEIYTLLHEVEALLPGIEVVVGTELWIINIPDQAGKDLIIELLKAQDLPVGEFMLIRRLNNQSLETHADPWQLGEALRNKHGVGYELRDVIEHRTVQLAPRWDAL